MLEYLAGVATLPVLAGIGWVGYRAIAHDGETGRECAICGFLTRNDRPIIRGIKWGWHDNTRGRTRQHRAELDAYLREWGLGKYRTDGGKPLSYGPT